MTVQQLRQELIKQFKPAWMLNDRAHHEGHFEAVFATGVYINNQLELGFDEKLILLAAYLHDLFAWSRENHHQLSQQFVLTSKSSVFEGLTGTDRYLVAGACLQHRASFHGQFSTNFAELFNAADREMPGTVQDLLDRAILYRTDRNPEMSEDEVLVNSVRHIKEKYGRNGYAIYPALYRKVFSQELERLFDQIDDLQV